MEEHKVCFKCKQLKHKSEYSPSKFALKSGWCKFCVSESGKKYRESHKEEIKERDKKYQKNHRKQRQEYNKQYREINKDKIKTLQKQYRKENKEALKVQNKKYYEKNRKDIIKYNQKYNNEHQEEIKEYKKNYYQQNKEEILHKQRHYQKDNNDKINLRMRTRRKNDPLYKMRCFISALIGKILKTRGGSKNGSSVWDHLYYDKNQLWSHIESQFEPWMNKNNQGKYNPETWDDDDPKTWKWQLDHIIPNSTFHYTSMEDEEFKKCWALTNLRPYSAKQNILDGTSRVRHKKQS